MTCTVVDFLLPFEPKTKNWSNLTFTWTVSTSVLEIDADLAVAEPPSGKVHS